MKSVLVIIPTYNEAENIVQLVDAVEAVAKLLPAYTFDILVIDDNSPDGTGKLVKKLQRKLRTLHLLTGAKQGLGVAYLRGFKHSLTELPADVIVMMDADFSHDPVYIPELIKAIELGADYVIGSRYIVGGSTAADWPHHRTIISRVANFTARKLVGIDKEVGDITGGFKAIRIEALARLNLDDIHAKGYFFQVSLLHAFLSRGFKVREIPITFTNRRYGNSKLRLRDVVEFIYSAYKLNPDAPVQKLVRFSFVGACGAVVNLAVLTLFLQVLKVEALLSIAAAIEVSILFNFLLNHYYTFKGYGAYKKQTRKESVATLLAKAGKYNIGTLGGAAISFATFTLLYKFVGLHYIFADVLAIAAAMSWNYWVSTRFVWRAIDAPETKG